MILNIENNQRGRFAVKYRVMSGLKDGLFVFIGVVLIALFFNYTGIHFGHNRLWGSLGNLNVINIFEDKALNGLLILGVILGMIAFILGFASPKIISLKNLKRNNNFK